MDKNDFLGLHSGIGDILEGGKPIGECIFDLEIVMMPTGRIEAEGIIVEVIEGNIDFEGKELTFVLSGLLTREDNAYFTEFSCGISPVTYPKFIVQNTEELFSNLRKVAEDDQKTE
jgi:hypothetical protein